MSIALYSLSEAYQNVLSLIDDEQPDQDILNALTVIEGAIEAKVVNIANVIKSLEAEAEAIKAEEQRLYQRRRVRENQVQNIKQYLQVEMQKVGMDKIKTPTRTVSIQSNPPALQIFDADIIPQKYLTLIPERYEPRKKDIADAIKAGEVVAGCELSRGKSLRIR